MGLFLRSALFVLLLCLPARAAEQAEAQADIGLGLICDTTEQIDRFVALRNNGRTTQGAVQSVNDEAHNPQACGIALIAFAERDSVGKKTIQGKDVSVLEITVLAVSDGSTWHRVPALTQYTIVAEKGIDV